ncbi:MAG: hypothetical protein OES79_07415, partial [Planctomycetota bacterium]|nr:hypothetical protein [Planctomycetota bacterium]
GGAARGGVGGFPGGPAIGGFGGGVGGRLPGNRFGGNIRNSPTFRPSPSLTPHQTFRPYPSLSPALNFNPAPSLFRPQRGGADPRPPVVPGGYSIIGLPRPSRFPAGPTPVPLPGGGAPITPEDVQPVIRIGSLAAPDQLVNVGQVIEQVRSKFTNQELFTAHWFEAHPDSWHVPAVAGHAWKAPSWLPVKYWLRIEQDGFSYFYGTNVVHRNGDVVVGDKRVATAADYRDSAREIAKRGQEPQKDGALWMALGVFAVVRSAGTDEVNEFVQLSVDMEGNLRGTIWTAKQETAAPIKGFVDTRSQRTVWRIGDDNGITYEAGIFNLTGQTVPLLIHAADSTAQHAFLVRLIQLEQD